MSGPFDDFLSRVVSDCVNGESGEWTTRRISSKQAPPQFTCVECGGSGIDPADDAVDCTDCDGTGVIR